MNPLPTPRPRRAFTLLEVMLAAVLGTLVVLTAMVLFTTMARTQARTENSDFGLQELTRLNNAARRALSQVVVYGFTPKRDPAAGASVARAVDGSQAPTEESEPLEVESAVDAVGDSLDADVARDGRTGAGAAGGGRTSPDGRPRPDPTKFPRIILEPDNAIGLQRLELVVAEPPALAGADGRLLEPDAGKRFTMTRGAFELRPSTDDSLPRGVRDRLEPGVASYDVWWVPVDHNEEGITPLGASPFGFGADGRSVGGGIVIARGITRFRWIFWRPDDSDVLGSSLSGTTTARSELPSYLELEVETVQRQKVKWMLEVGWTVQQPVRAADPVSTPRAPTGEPPDVSGRPPAGNPSGGNRGNGSGGGANLGAPANGGRS